MLASADFDWRCSHWAGGVRQTYFQNFGVYPYGDIRAFTGEGVSDDVLKHFVPQCDILCAGFPCQPFSRAGVSARTSLGRDHGFACPASGTLFFDIARIIKVTCPTVVLLENVPALCTHDRGRTFATIRETLEDELHYSFSHAIIVCLRQACVNRILLRGSLLEFG